MRFVRLSDEFFEDLKSGLTQEFVCRSCTNPLCSCSGAASTVGVWLPGEKDWVERKTGLIMYRGDEYTYPIDGACSFLGEDKQCKAGCYKPWDSHSFPFYIELYQGVVLPRWADNCSCSLQSAPSAWLAEIVVGWQKIISAVDPAWLEFYSQVPVVKSRVILPTALYTPRQSQ